MAAAHAVSPRYLHGLFEQQGLTVAGWIRRSRLERCRHDLADPRQRRRTVQAIAARWGFTSDAHFSRLFRAAYGVTPGEYRRQATVLCRVDQLHFPDIGASLNLDAPISGKWRGES
ncbi:helix-turn-helix domain-containing protein [Micromonospora sp. WMMD882]|uniref:helix-turn-helix domain-containing protein n=1 Tax=Micromonospora sp. WMMD882 TaxID=3015151 RepID=UPI00248D00AC|nr:helix-turn-helix domain-containing protein [Micromonospora sp. WMMD882]WBB82533.1 helix-turn-helix domain-containing protein [Micromonospora sp. WMMD882]